MPSDREVLEQQRAAMLEALQLLKNSLKELKERVELSKRGIRETQDAIAKLDREIAVLPERKSEGGESGAG
jgi:chromosome segregation ATPase